MFIGVNGNGFFGHPITHACDKRGHRAGSQLKMSNVFDKSWEPAVIVALSLSVTVTLSVSLSVRHCDLWPHFMMPTDRSYDLTL